MKKTVTPLFAWTRRFERLTSYLKDTSFTGSLDAYYQQTGTRQVLLDRIHEHKCTYEGKGVRRPQALQDFWGRVANIGAAHLGLKQAATIAYPEKNRQSCVRIDIMYHLRVRSITHFRPASACSANKGIKKFINMVVCCRGWGGMRDHLTQRTLIWKKRRKQKDTHFSRGWASWRCPYTSIPLMPLPGGPTLHEAIGIDGSVVPGSCSYERPKAERCIA